MYVNINMCVLIYQYTINGCERLYCQVQCTNNMHSDYLCYCISKRIAMHIWILLERIKLAHHMYIDDLHIFRLHVLQN